MHPGQPGGAGARARQHNGYALGIQIGQQTDVHQNVPSNESPKLPAEPANPKARGHRQQRVEDRLQDTAPEDVCGTNSSDFPPAIPQTETNPKPVSLNHNYVMSHLGIGFGHGRFAKCARAHSRGGAR